MKNQIDFLDYIYRPLTRTSEWRRQIANRFPNDVRNERAAEKLAKLADEATALSDDTWQKLAPHFNPEDDHWCETVSQTCRDVAFKTNPRDFGSFAERLACNFPAAVSH